MVIWDENHVISKTEEFMLDWAGIPEYQRCEADLQPDAVDIEMFEELSAIRRSISNFTRLGDNLVICGKNLGCGKTEWALKLMLTFIEESVHKFKFIDEREELNVAVFCQTVPFLVEMKQFGSNRDTFNTYDKLCSAELVVFDDVAAIPMSKYDYSVLYAMIERRLFSGLSTIYTTNATSKEELEKEVGPRLAERIWKTSRIIELKGMGYRGV